MNVKISPSLMCAEQLDLKQEIKNLEKAGIDSFHLDIMDGHLVDNFGLNFKVIEEIKEITNVPLELHLYLKKPAMYINKFVQVGGDIITFHVETTNSPLRLLKMIRSLGTKAGIALYPSTFIDNYEYLLDFVDTVTVLTVEPGFSGQRFLPAILKKIRKIKNLAEKNNLHIDIEVDGNINVKNAVMSIKAGANVLVCGTSAIFCTNDTISNLEEFRKGIKANKNKYSFKKRNTT